MGDLLRRYWMPFILSSRARCRRRAAAREAHGRRSDRLPQHRGQSRLARRALRASRRIAVLRPNADCRLRCWYHGWQYDLDGNCTDQPNEPPQTQFRQQVKQKAYPSIEKNGVGLGLSRPEGQAAGPARIRMAERAGRPCPCRQAHPALPLDARARRRHRFIASRLPARPCDLAAGEFQPRGQSALGPRRAGIRGEADAGRAASQATCREPRTARVTGASGSGSIPCFTTIPPRGGDQPLQGHSWTPIDNGSSLGLHLHLASGAAATRGESCAASSQGTNFHAHLVPGSFEPLANKANEYAGPSFEREKQPWMRIK